MFRDSIELKIKTGSETKTGQGWEVRAHLREWFFIKITLCLVQEWHCWIFLDNLL